jgi:hypothetical protein
VIRTAVLGLVFALIVLAAGSLWPAMIAHALLDLHSGDVGYRALGEDLALPRQASCSPRVPVASHPRRRAWMRRPRDVPQAAVWRGVRKLDTCPASAHGGAFHPAPWAPDGADPTQVRDWTHWHRACDSIAG